MKEQVWAFVDVLGLFVCMYVCTRVLWGGWRGCLEEKRSGE